MKVISHADAHRMLELLELIVQNLDDGSLPLDCKTRTPEGQQWLIDEVCREMVDRIHSS